MQMSESAPTLMTETAERAAALVDRFIAESWGICDPAPYRAAMVQFFDKAICWAVAKERERCASVAREAGRRSTTIGREIAEWVAEEIERGR
jgi:hypothetical protein